MLMSLRFPVKAWTEYQIASGENFKPPPPRPPKRTDLDQLVLLAQHMKVGDAVLLRPSTSQVFRTILVAQGFDCITDGYRSKPHERPCVWTFKLARKSVPLQDECWKPNESRLNYVAQVMEAFCVLWPDEGEQIELMRQAVERKINAAWTLEWRNMPEGHKSVCAKVFWDALAFRYPSKVLDGIQAVWDESLNQANDARCVAVMIQPMRRAERAQIDLEAALPEPPPVQPEGGGA